jgi:hypothetical protein
MVMVNTRTKAQHLFQLVREIFNPQPYKETEMSSTKTKSQSIALVDTAEDPRVRMKEVRAMVKLAHKQNIRVDLMDFNRPDTARSQIALQDMLAKEQEKHAKARGLIINLKMVIQEIMLSQIMVVGENGRMESNTRRDRESIRVLEDDLTEANDLNDQMRADLESTMNSLRVALSGQINAEG